MRSPLMAWLVLAAQLACSEHLPPIELSAPAFGAGTAGFEVLLARDYLHGTLRVYLDGRRLAPDPGPDPASRRLRLELPVSRGPHLVVLVAEFEQEGRRATRIESALFVMPAGAPALRATRPLAEALAVARDAWLELEFVAALSDELLGGFELACEGLEVAAAVHRLSPVRIVVNPAGRLPASQHCVLAWPGQDGREAHGFTTAAERSEASVVYDPLDPGSTAPFPDDYFSEADAASPTGLRLRLPDRSRPGVAALFAPLQKEVGTLDGYSPLAHLVLELSHAVDPTSLPRTPADSLDPLAPIALIDIHPESPDFGERMPVRIEARSATSVDGLGEHSLLIYPSIPLRPSGRYGLLVSRRIRARDGRPFRPSLVMEASLRSGRAGDPDQVARVRKLVAPLLEVAEHVLEPPLPREDLALALCFTVGSMERLSSDMLAIREQIFARPPPQPSIDRVERVADAASPVAAVVHGRWAAPELREDLGFARDESGRPRLLGEVQLPFTLTLPHRALQEPVPVVMYQHGNPGSAELEVPSRAQDYLAEAGFAVVGFTDALNRAVPARSVSPRAAVTAQVFALFTAIMLNERVPDFWAQTHAEQLAFLRVIEALGGLDLLPVGAPDGRPEIDARRPISYLGVSEGANHGPALLAYAPEVQTAVLVAGGARLAELMIHQAGDSVLGVLPRLFPGLRPVDVWVVLALFQTAFDRQDAHNHARYVFREPLDLPFAPVGEPRRASVLLIAGLDDSLVPNHASDSLAWQLGPLPQQGPVARSVPFLEQREGPLRANLAVRTTGAYVQVVPTGVPGVAPTAGCVPPAIDAADAGEGHLCAQLAAESRHQRATFLRSALDGSAPIVEPMPGPGGSRAEPGEQGRSE